MLFFAGRLSGGRVCSKCGGKAPLDFGMVFDELENEIPGGAFICSVCVFEVLTGERRDYIPEVKNHIPNKKTSWKRLFSWLWK